MKNYLEKWPSLSVPKGQVGSGFEEIFELGPEIKANSTLTRPEYDSTRKTRVETRVFKKNDLSKLL